MYKLQRFRRAAGDAGLFSIGASFFIPVRGVETEVAFHRYVFIGVPYGPVGPLGAGFYTFPAADAYFWIDHPDVAVIRIHMTGAGGAVLYTERRYALPAYGHGNIVRVFCEGRRVADDLDSRKRETRHAFMGQ